jgi:hypothetical protein
MVRNMKPGSVFAGYRIEGVEREEAGAAVLRARDPRKGDRVTLHVAGEPGSLATVRFLERANRLGTVEHPHLLGVYDARTLEGRAVAVAEAPPGRRLDELLVSGALGVGAALKITRQVASAVDALEDAGAEPPLLSPERIWVDANGNAQLDGLDARSGLAAIVPAASSSAALARLLREMSPQVPSAADTVITRALDGAYLSAGQLAEDLGRVERGAADRRRRIALAIVAVTILVLAALVLLV